MPETMQFIHSLSEMVNSVIAAGMRIDRITEHSHCNWQRFDAMQQDEAGWSLPCKLPMLLTIEATKT